MPELPEVETVRRQLAPWLTGRTVRTARRADAPSGPKYAHLERADGQTIRGVERRGKWLILPLSTGDELLIHLGMTGVVSATSPASHHRVTVELEPRGDRDTLYFQDIRRFGRFLVAPAGDYAGLPSLQKMGPEPLSEAFTPELFHANLKRSATAIKQHLMSQRAVAGVGNIYCDEALWIAKIHPRARSNRISRRRAEVLRDAIIDVLRASIERQGTTLRDYRTVDGDSGGYASRLNVYGKTGQPCPRCPDRAVKRILLGQRSTHFCRGCQRY